MAPGPAGPSARRLLVAAVVAFCLLVFVALTLVVTMTYMGGVAVANDVRKAVATNPVLLERIGRVDTVGPEWLRSATVPGKDVFVFRAWGPKGEVLLVLETITVDDGEDVRSGHLQLPDGSQVEMFPDRPPGPASAPRPTAGATPPDGHAP